MDAIERIKTIAQLSKEERKQHLKELRNGLKKFHTIISKKPGRNRVTIEVPASIVKLLKDKDSVKVEIKIL